MLGSEPLRLRGELSTSNREFENAVISTLQDRLGDEQRSLEIKALTLMATSWVVTAAHIDLTEGRPSLVGCFDEAVAAGVKSISRDLGGH